MAKIGTAHIEIKPVLNEEALEAIVKRIEGAIDAGVTRALHKSKRHADRIATVISSEASVLDMEYRKRGAK